ncbi:bifunctional adenosylcobinamide kinase/adenosylcobinamide-phosphate guanylyltransferase [Leptothoe kymatousa]|uniref:Adenosylcobinamide kinase n=1 Tax=Leptothoe kymatousa TAU-MAC 1615 TaxID=2364775 RepID=A0ABS5XYU4_9CYAN|nr:bifunctional adenosylcobinamide kinase/adenosylcobinamide-phosphate guanylyltransferase [Leptothoe kymatousa]MBT9310789.1 bifunctional adenosylcobinamide kinase/adenosylcobinamide-phosphate guanylyltransferase [Leptothoe kymatousa TAU-MAC 1615]
MAELILVTGPARSGKSEWAEHWADKMQKSVIYIATSTLSAEDTEWQERVQKHRQRRPSTWQTQEVPRKLALAIQQGQHSQCLLVDSLGTWLANFLDDDDTAWQHSQDELLAALATAECDVIFVAEETGWGLVPAYPLGRLFRDRLGSLVRQIGQIATQVYLITGGYALDLKHLGTPFPKKSP